MRLLICGLLVVLVGSICLAENVVLCPHSCSQEGEFLIAIERERIAKLPAIDIEREDPPVTIKEAVATAKAYVYKRFANAKNLGLMNLTFGSTEYATLPDIHLWQYEVRFYGYNEEDQEQTNAFLAYIAMDGKPLLFLDKKTKHKVRTR
jgi:hypothetical protein